MVRRIDENGFRWLEPPYTPEEQMLLGGKPPFPKSVHAEVALLLAPLRPEAWLTEG